MSQAALKMEAKAKTLSKLAREAHRRLAVENSADCNLREAMELLDAAARCYRISGKPLLAADRYARCADTCLRVHNGEFAAAIFWSMCAELRESHDPGAALDAYDRAVGICCDVARWDAAGVLATKAAALEDRRHERKARFTTAADLFAAAADADETRSASSASCLERAASLAAVETAEYDAAADAFERLAADAAADNLLAFNCPRIMLKAALCRVVAADLQLALGKIQIFGEIYKPWRFATERHFLLDLCDCLKAELPDKDLFADVAFDFAQIRRLDRVDLALLHKLHLSIEKAHADHQLALDKAQWKADKLQQKQLEEKERLLRIQRDLVRPARGT